MLNSSIRYASNSPTAVKIVRLSKFQRATQVLHFYFYFSNSGQTGFASYNELLKCCIENSPKAVRQAS